ncbi:hypothetical protein ACFLU6_06990 [Acidobacteriota bacterium]
MEIPIIKAGEEADDEYDPKGGGFYIILVNLELDALGDGIGDTVGLGVDDLKAGSYHLAEKLLKHRPVVRHEAPLQD